MQLCLDMPRSIGEKDLHTMRLPNYLWGARLAQLQDTPSYPALTKYLKNIHSLALTSKGLCFVGPNGTDKITPAAVLLRAFRAYNATCFYAHCEDVGPAMRREEPKVFEHLKTVQVLLLEELPNMPNAYNAELLAGLIRRRRQAGLITLATLSTMICLVESGLRSAYADACFFIAAAPEKVWVDAELPEAARVYSFPAAPSQSVRTLPVSPVSPQEAPGLAPPPAATALEVRAPSSSPSPVPSPSPDRPALIASAGPRRAPETSRRRDGEVI